MIKERLITFNKLSFFLLSFVFLLFSCQETGIQEKQLIKISGNAIEVSTELLELKTEEGIVYHKNKPFTGRSISHYPNGVKKSERTYYKGKKHGFYKKWFQSGLLSFEENYQMGKKNGTTKSWWINGNLRSESNFMNGLGQGDQWQYYKSGAKFKKIHLVDGREEGIQQSWRENGKLYNNYEAKNGRIFGLKRANLCFSLDNEEVVLDSNTNP